MTVRFIQGGVCCSGGISTPEIQKDLYYYDETLGLFLTVDEQKWHFFTGNRNITTNRWMNISENIPSNITGYNLGAKNYLITKIFLSSKQTLGNITYNIYNRNTVVYSFSTTLEETEKNLFDVNIQIPVATDIKASITTDIGAMVGYPTVLLHTREIVNIP
jgi:hypothetical protein